jgi:acyl carrier protein
MTEADILAGLTPVFQDVLDLPGLVLTPDTQAADVPGWDSVAHITLVVAIEQKFGLRFSTADVEELRNVGDLVKLVARKQAA